MKIRYYLGALLSIPFLPLMYYQGKRIRAKIPQLPEAKGIEGQTLSNNKTNKTLNLIAIGESTIAGVGVETHQEGLTGTLAKELSKLFQTNVKWKVYARSGFTASAVERKLVPKIVEKDPHLILIGLGGNDAFTLNQPAKWKKQIRSLITSLQSKFPKSAIVFCNMPPIKEFPAFTPLIKFTIGNLVEILGEELQSIATETDNVYYFKEIISLKSWMHKLNQGITKNDFFSDGVHPSKLTYQTWAKDMAKGISENEQIKSILLNVIG